jgi:hypothetical protein
MTSPAVAITAAAVILAERSLAPLKAAAVHPAAVPGQTFMTPHPLISRSV